MANRGSIVFFGSLQDTAQTRGLQPIVFAEAVTLGQLLAGQQIDLETVGFTTVNDQVVKLDYLLKDGDQIKIFPLIIGG